MSETEQRTRRWSGEGESDANGRLRGEGERDRGGRGWQGSLRTLGEERPRRAALFFVVVGVPLWLRPVQEHCGFPPPIEEGVGEGDEGRVGEARCVATRRLRMFRAPQGDAKRGGGGEVKPRRKKKKSEKK